MNLRDKLMIAIGGLAAIPVVAASAVIISNNIGTPDERCDRFWVSSQASYECHRGIYMTQSAENQREIDAAQQNIDAIKGNIRNLDEARHDVESRQAR